jgi:hypothetical protein
MVSVDTGQILSSYPVHCVQSQNIYYSFLCRLHMQNLTNVCFSGISFESARSNWEGTCWWAQWFRLLLAVPILLFVVSIFSSCMDLPMRTLWYERQCYQGAEISGAKHLDSLSKISTGITIKRLIFPYHFGCSGRKLMIWQHWLGHFAPWQGPSQWH